MPNRHTITLNEPATGFTSGFALGNGWLGATVHGRPDHERIDLNLDTLWSGGPGRGASHDTFAGLLRDLRDATRRADHAAADTLARQLHSTAWTEAYQPLGQLRWRVAVRAEGRGPEPGAYARSLDLATAVASARTRAGSEELHSIAFVSAPAGVLVYEVTGVRLEEVPAPQLLVEHEGISLTSRRQDGVAWTTLTGRAPVRSLPDYVDAADAVMYAVDEPDHDGLVDAGMGFAVVCAVHGVGPDRVRLILSARSGHRGWDQRPSADVETLARIARDRVESALGRPTDELLAEHSADYRGYFERTDLRLSGPDPERSDGGGSDDAGTVAAGFGPADLPTPARAELLFHLGKYLLISSSRPGTEAANLQGIWNVDARPAWSCNYTTNINLEMNYWSAQLLGLDDLQEPLSRLTRELVESGTPVASRLYAGAGSVTHHNTDLWRFSLPVAGEPQWASWTMAQAWLLAAMWEHWTHTGDDQFARAHALPTHAAVVDWVLSTLIHDEEDQLRVSPSTSPEHQFLTPGDGPAAVTAGASVDQELAHEVLTHYLQLAATDPEQARLHGTRITRAAHALGRLRLPRIATDGTLMEWSDDLVGSEPGHRHLSHLYGLFPGRRITESRTPADFEAVGRSLHARLSHGSGYTSWSQAWVLCLAARLRDAALVEASVDNFVASLASPSLLGIHPHGGWEEGRVFQIDGNLGAVAGLAEAYVQDRDGVLVLMAAPLPSAVEGHLTGVRCPGGRRVDVRWEEGRLAEATIHASRSGTLAVEVPATADEVTVRVDGDESLVDLRRGPGVADRRLLTFTARAGETYRITPTGVPDLPAHEHGRSVTSTRGIDHEIEREEQRR